MLKEPEGAGVGGVVVGGGGWGWDSQGRKASRGQKPGVQAELIIGGSRLQSYLWSEI